MDRNVPNALAPFKGYSRSSRLWKMRMTGKGAKGKLTKGINWYSCGRSSPSGSIRAHALLRLIREDSHCCEMLGWKAQPNLQRSRSRSPHLAALGLREKKTKAVVIAHKMRTGGWISVRDIFRGFFGLASFLRNHFSRRRVATRICLSYSFT